MLRNPPSSDVYAIAAAVNQADTPRAAAWCLARWLSERGQPAMIGLLHPDTAALELAISPGYTPDQAAITWMQSADSWLLWQQWDAPRLADDAITIPGWQGAALLVPLRCDGAFYGLLWLHGQPEDTRTPVVLAALVAARLHYLVVSSRWDSLLANAIIFSRALSQEASGDELWQMVHHQIADLFDTSSFCVGLLAPGTNNLHLPVYSENDLPVPQDAIPLSGLNRAVIQHGLPLLIGDLNAERERLDALHVTPDAGEADTRAASWLGVPLRNHRGEITGLVSIQNTLPNSYTDPDLHLLMYVAGQIGLAVEHRRLLQTEQERRRVASTLMEVAQVVNSSLDYEEVLERILEQMRRVVSYDSASILLPMLGSGLRLVVSALNGDYPAARGTEIIVSDASPAMRVYQSQQPFVIGSIQDWIGWDADLPTGPQARAWLGVPMLIQNRVIGLITLDSAVPDHYTESEASTIFALARQAAIAVENTRLLARSEAQRSALEQRTRRLSSMHQIATMLSASLEKDVVLSTAAKLLAELFEVDHCGIVLLNLKEVRASLVAEYPDSGHVGLDIPMLGRPMFERLVRETRVLMIADTDAPDGVDDAMRDAFQRLGVRASLVAPLVARNQFIGSIFLNVTNAGRLFNEDEQETLLTIAAQVALAIHNAQLYEEAVTINRLKSELMANMSHELRTPLNAIIGYSEMLLSDVYGALNPKQVDRLERVHSGGTHLLALINDILDLSRIESGALSLVLAPMSVSEVINEVAAESAGRAREKGLAIHVRLDDALPPVEADVVRFRQVVANLVDNAIKFTDSGSITLQASTAESRNGQLQPAAPASFDHLPDGRWLVVTISDTGIGIHSDDLPVIFDAFRQVDGSSVRRHEGTGLGLTLARHLMKLHQGNISVSSEPGQGTTFTILLPLQSEAARIHAPSTAESERPTLLVIDDDPAVVQLVHDFLDPALYHVVGMTNPGSALELARRLRPAAIITDIMMPDVSGWEVLRSLKADKETADIPVIILSVIEQTAVGFFLGAADYLTKPINRQALYSALERAVRVEPRAPILVVDDNDDDRTFLADMLARTGYSVAQVSSGEAALDWLADQSAALILLDLVLPGLSGFEVLERLRGSDATAAIPVIVVTGADVSDAQRESLHTPVLQKAGISDVTLVKQVQTALSRGLRQRASTAADQ